MGPEDTVEPVMAGWVSGCLSGMFVWKICPGMQGESTEPSLM